jgi:predicted nucleotidyltransferase
MTQDEKTNAEKLLSEKEEKKAPEEIPEKVKKEMEQLKEKLEGFKKDITKKFPFISAIGLLPFQAIKLFEEEEEESKKEKEKMIHIAMIIPDEKEKELGKVKTESIKLIQHIKPKLWIHFYTPSMLWEMACDGKHEMMEAVAMSLPIFDKGFLGALRVASIHKSLCLKKFEKYIVSYVIAGSIVRGDTTKTSDVDVFIIVDDTDVKRMSRAELRDKLRGIIYGYAMQANELADSKNKLSPQIYILTEFWEGVRESHPVFFTFIRDGVPLYDRGTFMPWKLLLKMGKITGTPEAIERFLTLGEKVDEIVKHKLNDIATEDIYWAVITPSQGALMMYGLAPPTPKEIVDLMRKTFLEKEKLMEKKYIDFLEHVVIDIYKGFEHEKIKEVSGKEIDELVKGTKEYIKRLKEVVDEVGKRRGEKTIQQLYSDTMTMLQSLLGNGTEPQLIAKFEQELVNQGKMPRSSIEIIKEIFKSKKDYEKGKLSSKEIENTRRDGLMLLSMLSEYGQRKQLIEMDKAQFAIKLNGKDGEIFFTGDDAFIIPDIKIPEIKKIDLKKLKISKSSKEELDEALKKLPEHLIFSKSVLEKIERLVGKLEIMF